MKPVRGSGIGGGHDHHQLVGVGHHRAFDRVGVVGAAAQQGLAVLDLDQPGQGVRLAGDVAHEGDEVAGHHGVAAQFPGPGGDDRPFIAGVLADDGRVAAAVNGDDAPGDGVVMAGRSLVRGREPFLLGRIRTSDSSQESVLRATGGPCAFRGQRALPCASMSAHSCGKSGMVLAVVAMSWTSMPCTARPRMAPAVAIRWSA